MILRIFAILMVYTSFATAWAQPNCVEETQCRSQLIRVEVSNSIFQNNGQSLLPILQNFSASPTLPAMIERSYPLPTLDFPHNKESCEREKRTNPLFAEIDCSAKGLCGRPNLHPQVREAMCFKLPCPLFEGTLQTGSCGSEQNIYPNQISFPTPVNIQKIRMTPTRVDFSSNRATMCFRITELALNMSVRLSLDTRNTQLRDSGINITNVNPVLDGPREVCMSAGVDLASATPISNFTLTSPDGTPFISDEMIRTASQSLSIDGLSGYPAGQIDSIKGEIVPVIFQPLRDTVETAVRQSLSTVFEQQINTLASQASGSSSHLVSSENLASELGIGNLQIRNQLAKTECAALRGAGRPIPPTHACVGLPGFSGPITPENFSSPMINELMSLEYVSRDLQLTSESVKQRLIAMKDVIRAQIDEFDRPEDNSEFQQDIRRRRRENLEVTIREYIDPLVDRISRNQLEGQVVNFIQIQNQLSSGNSRNVGVSVPEICSDTNPSPHARKSIPNCPIQAYVDLNEMNQVFDRLWKAGRICQQGRGPYVPTMADGQQSYDPEGKPIGSGCYMEMGGMGCYLNSAPQIQYDARTRKYKTRINLKACYRGPVLFGQGRFGGDFNIDFAFTPKACHGGDFCMDNPDVSWNVVPGTERFGLRPSSFFRDMISGRIEDAMKSAVGDTIRIPMASGVGPLASIPLEAEGRVDSGPGYFGACLRLRGSAGVSGQ
ncbi:MAG: hypothetical protein V4598_01005 [Bdellovibrionota bacterium]